MLTAINYYTATVLFALIHRSFSAMVLPRPPSSPNYIQRFDRKENDQKFYEGKHLQNFLQNSNVERANTNDYSLVEIELQSPDEMDAANLQNIVHVMLKQSEQIQNETYPHPEVISHSIFGVRDVGLTSNFKMNVNEDRHVLGLPKLQNLDEKFYYLKNSRPKVYVNVRGHSGSFQKGNNRPKTTSNNNPIEFLRMTPPLERQTDWKSHYNKIIHPLKKFEHRINTKREYQKHLSKNEIKKLSRLAVIYGLEDLSTTESSMVTSSELPKQIPAPPSKLPNRILMAQTTPVQRYALRRTNILPEYSFSDI